MKRHVVLGYGAAGLVEGGGGSLGLSATVTLAVVSAGDLRLHLGWDAEPEHAVQQTRAACAHLAARADEQAARCGRLLGPVHAEAGPHDVAEAGGGSTHHPCPGTPTCRALAPSGFEQIAGGAASAVIAWTTRGQAS